MTLGFGDVGAGGPWLLRVGRSRTAAAAGRVGAVGGEALPAVAPGVDVFKLRFRRSLSMTVDTSAGSSWPSELALAAAACSSRVFRAVLVPAPAGPISELRLFSLSLSRTLVISDPSLLLATLLT